MAKRVARSFNSSGYFLGAGMIHILPGHQSPGNPGWIICVEEGITLADGMGNNETKVLDSTIARVEHPVILGSRGDPQLVNLRIDGALVRGTEQFRFKK